MKYTFAFLLTLGTVGSMAATTVTYDFSGLHGTPASSTVTSGMANLTEGAITRSSGIGAIASNGIFASNGWTSSNSVGTSDYYTFTLTPDAGYALDLTSLVFSAQSNFAGPDRWAVRSSLDHFSANLATGTTGTNASRNTVTFGSALATLTNALELRIYGYASGNNENSNSSQFWLGATSSNNPGHMASNLVLNLSLNAVTNAATAGTADVPAPEPASNLLVGLALLAWPVARRFRRG